MKNEKEVTRFEVSTSEGIYRAGIIEKEGKMFFYFIKWKKN